MNSNVRFSSLEGTRRILVVDDEMINREILGAMLRESYEVVYAENGAEALEIMRENSSTLSLVLLDILMPVMTGLEVLKAMKEDAGLSKIPVIVLTADQESEVECLNLGAVDFIPKPYPAQSVVLARVLRTIELTEDRETIQSTERDALTGLYNKEYFYRYAEQFDHYHKDTGTDAIILDIHHFHLINERYGKNYGDAVLKEIARKVQHTISQTGGICCRKEADTFMAYCPHREDYKEIVDKTMSELTVDDGAGKRIRIRMGVYADTDKGIDMERRFDRAKAAADTIKGNLTKMVAYYDRNLHDAELYSEQLIEDFYHALEEKQFAVYFQPKFDVRPESPVLNSAEALVRWIHPELGFISPGVFIPLFEENGLIYELDSYVWRQTCAQLKEWQDTYGAHISVSVNVSRGDLYETGFAGKIKALVSEYGLTPRDLMLEVTESSYTDDSGQITEVVTELREAGFLIEMDDFGTGYSSLNMLSSLPFDVLKLDMHFIRDAFRNGGSTRMMELIIDIADYLSVPVVAEGVETEEQLKAVKEMGCAYVQGYYFSKPLPADEFEKYVKDRSVAEKAPDTVPGSEKDVPVPEEYASKPGKHFSEEAEKREELGEELHSVIREQDGIGNTGVNAGENFVKGRFHLKTASVLFVVIALIAAAALMVSDIAVTRGYRIMEEASDRYLQAQISSTDMETGSDFLTDRVRCFVVTGDIEYLNEFFEEVNVTKRRDKAVQDLETLLEYDQDNEALKSLTTALGLSNELLQTELHAMKLELEADGYTADNADIPDELVNIRLNEEEEHLTPEEKSELAQTLVFDSNYMEYKDRIRENVNNCTQSLIAASSLKLNEASSRMTVLVFVHTILSIVFLLLVLVLVIFINETIRKPLSNMVAHMRSQETIPPRGAEELQFVTRTYNAILEENREAHERLSHEASHDALTGVFNRGAYDMLMETVDTSHIALMIVDVDHFKEVNDSYGHTVGDRVLKKVADILKQSFRSVDIICRIGGDEFVVIMTRVNSDMSELVKDKIKRANILLRNPGDDLPPVSLSVGVAFSDRKNPQGDIFKDADTALYKVKQAGRNGCVIY